jgi:hypothetical protein
MVKDTDSKKLTKPTNLYHINHLANKVILGL